MLLGGLVIALTIASPLDARAETLHALKGAFVLNFLKFSSWPASASESTGPGLVVASIGDGPLAPALKKILENKTVRGQPVEVQIYRDAAEWLQAKRPCHAIFLTPQAGAAWAELRAAVAGRPVLTIAEVPGFCAAGGMLNLFEERNRVRFEANPEAVKAAGLKLRSELLKLATIVKTTGGTR